MNHSLNLHRPAPYWLKDAQFAVGVMVSVGGAAALLAELVHLLA